ncbi:transglycosylase, Slt family [Candidatus Symbiothrix dinenymphae]|nr:transglycosylase, Slt family [Candidatus Symbiothrix dinenymphae]
MYLNETTKFFCLPTNLKLKSYDKSFVSLPPISKYNVMQRGFHGAIGVLSLLILTTNCGKEEDSDWDLPQILQGETLDVLTISGSMSYYVYRDDPLGYEYELLSDFAKSQGLTLNIQTVASETKLTEMLLNGDGDLIAYNIPITIEGEEILRYAGREVIDHQVLVQRANKGDTPVRDVTELIGKTVWVVKNSKYERRLRNLNEEVGGGIEIKTVDEDSLSTEDLLEMVSDGRIRYAVSDAALAKLNKTYYNNINIALDVSFSQRSSWAVRPTEPLLAQALDEWFAENAKTSRTQAIAKRYFERSKNPFGKNVPKIPKGNITPYDAAFKKYADTIQWDWCLLAAIAYQESRFHTQSESWAGAKGMMGLMPRTAASMGITQEQTHEVEASILAAARLIKRLNDKYFAGIKNEEERIKFILASYNAGSGHIRDAIALAKKYNKNPNVWEDNVSAALRWKMIPEYYNDPVVKQGYFRPGETLSYVRNVMERWKAYQARDAAAARANAAQAAKVKKVKTTKATVAKKQKKK